MKSHYLIQVDGRQLIVGSGKDKEEARQAVLKSHPVATCVKVIGEVEDIENILKPYIIAKSIPKPYEHLTDKRNPFPSFLWNS